MMMMTGFHGMDAFISVQVPEEGVDEDLSLIYFKAMSIRAKILKLHSHARFLMNCNIILILRSSEEFVVHFRKEP
jgi:hypothetical protein